MTKSAQTLTVNQMQWIKLQIRLAALEQKGQGLSHRFEFPDYGTVVCHVYFTEHDSNPLKDLPANDKLEIYQGWMNIGKDIIEHALEAAELPSTFVWSPALRFFLHVSNGMGSSVVHESEVQFRWPSPG